MLRIAYACEVGERRFALTSRIQQRGFAPWWRSARVTVFGVTGRPTSVRLGGQSLSSGWNHDAQARTLTVEVPDALGEWGLEVSLQDDMAERTTVLSRYAR